MDNNNNNSLEQYLVDIYEIAIDLGFSQEDALQLQAMKTALFKSEEEYQGFLNDIEKLKLRRTIPLTSLYSLEEWENTDKESKETKLWDFGIDILRFPYFIDAGICTLDDERYIGLYIIGNERTDPEWKKSGYATWEAEFWGLDPSLINEMKWEYIKE